MLTILHMHGNKDPRALLLTPRAESLPVTPELKRKIAKFLATTLEVNGNEAKKYIPETLKQWGRLQISDGGDMVHARGYHKLREDTRDSSFVRVSI